MQSDKYYDTIDRPLYGRYHREDHYEGHATVFVPAPPVVVVRPPEIIIR
jgi:hypothetical protein